MIDNFAPKDKTMQEKLIFKSMSCRGYDNPMQIQQRAKRIDLGDGSLLEKREQDSVTSVEKVYSNAVSSSLTHCS